MQETWETRLQPLGGEEPLEEGMATHRSILVWRIPWTEEPGGLQSTGLQKELDMTEQLNNNNVLFCSLVAQSCLTLCDPVDCSPPGSSVHRIIQARLLEWVAMPSGRGTS